jgi:hypothetical protein
MEMDRDMSPVGPDDPVLGFLKLGKSSTRLDSSFKYNSTKKSFRKKRVSNGKLEDPILKPGASHFIRNRGKKVPISNADGKKSAPVKIVGSSDNGSGSTRGESISGCCRDSNASGIVGPRQGAVAGQLMTFLTMRFANDDSIKSFSQCDSDIQGMLGIGKR